jgi:hypothetical protein
MTYLNSAAAGKQAVRLSVRLDIMPVVEKPVAVENSKFQKSGQIWGIENV